MKATPLGRHISAVLKASNTGKPALMVVWEAAQVRYLIQTEHGVYVGDRAISVEIQALAQIPTDGQTYQISRLWLKNNTDWAVRPAPLDLITQWSVWEALQSEPLRLTRYLVDEPGGGLRVLRQGEGAQYYLPKNEVDAIHPDWGALRDLRYELVTRDPAPGHFIRIAEHRHKEWLTLAYELEAFFEGAGILSTNWHDLVPANSPKGS